MNLDWLGFQTNMIQNPRSHDRLRLWAIHPGGESLSLTYEDHLFIDDLHTIRRDERRDSEVTIEFSLMSAYSHHFLDNIS